jgi:hypothetical protein
MIGSNRPSFNRRRPQKVRLIGLARFIFVPSHA